MIKFGWIFFLCCKTIFFNIYIHLPLKPTWRSCFFHSHNPKPKQNHQIASSRAKTRSTRSQTCVKYRGINVFIKRNSDVNTGDLKILHQKMSKYGWFSRRYLQFLKKFMCFAFNFMHDWRAVTKTVHFAPRYQGQSLSVQCYEFYLHAILFL